MLSDYRPIICANIKFINNKIVDRAIPAFCIIKKKSVGEKHICRSEDS